MEILNVTRKDIDLKEFVKRSALEDDCPNLITKDTVIVHDGHPIVVYQKLDVDTSPLTEVLQRIPYQQSERTGGLKTVSRVFGYQPRVALRRDYCTATSLAYEDSNANDVVCSFGKQIEQIYQEYFPATHDKHRKLSMEKILPEWRVSDTCFTSGIINKNNPLKYHFDSGNFEDVCSCMIGLKRDIGGGHLSFPEFGFKLEISDRSLSIFDGQSVLHGVTPIVRVTPKAYRYTIVYYTLKGMWNCAPLTEEIARIKAMKTKREMKRAGLLDEVVVDQHGEQEGT